MAVRIPGINIDEYYQQLGPIEPLIRDDRVTEIMVNGSDHVYVEMGGKVVLTNIKFLDEDQLLNVIQFIVRTVGRRIDERSPLCDARLADGSRVNAVIRPLPLNGPLLTVRKFSRDPFQVDDLIRFGTCNEAGFGFMKAAVLAKANIIISGGTGTGKTTFLNVLSSYIRSMCAAWKPVRRTSTARARSPFSASSSTPCACVLSESSSASAAAARPWTCSRP